VIWAPVRTLMRVAEERRVLLGFGVVALYAALKLLIAVVDILGGVTESAFNPEDFPELPPEIVESLSQSVGVGALILAVLSPFVGWAVVSLLMQLVTRFFGGTGPLSGMFAVVGVAAVPLVIASAIELPATGLQAVVGPQSTAAAIVGALLLLLSLAAYAWNVVLVVIGTAFARHIGYGQSAGSCAISCAGCAGLILIVAVVLGVLAAVLSQAAGSAAAP
jgi:hypothetical protein